MIKDLEIKENILTDGSKTHDVHFTPMVAQGEQRHLIVFHCFDKAAARALIETIDQTVSGVTTVQV